MPMRPTRVSRRSFLESAALVTGLLPSSRAAIAQPDEDLHYMSVTEVARRIEKKEISPVELTRAMLARIERIDGRLKSYTTVMADQALASAKAAENAIQNGSYRGLLHGVPIAVKDLYFTKGVPTMGGTKVLADHVPSYDATVVSKLRDAGAVVLGKLNLTEGAMAGYHPDFDVPVNPWREDRWPGASSSGSGVATAAGLCFASLGSDTGGSIRFPAACNGVVGLKPTYGRVSRYGVLALAESLDHVGPLARTSADAGIMLEAIAGHDKSDLTSLTEPVPSMLDGIDGGVSGLRIGYDEAYATEGTDEGLVASIREVLQRLERLGARIVEVEVPDASTEDWFTRASAEAAAAHEANYPSRRDEYGSFFREFLDQGAAVTGVQYAKAHKARAEFRGAFRAMLREVDVLACPSMPWPPLLAPPNSLYGSFTEVMSLFEGDIGRFTGRFDFSGSPTISLPCGFSDEGLPYLFTADAGVGAGQKRPPRLSYSACSGPGGSRFANWANGLNGLRASWVD